MCVRASAGERLPLACAPRQVRDMAAAIAQTELRSRSRDQCGGMGDHVFFEGLELEKDGVYEIRWGS